MPPGEVGYINQTTFGSVKEQIFRDIIQQDIPLNNNIQSRSQSPLPLFNITKNIQSTLLIGSSCGLVCTYSNQTTLTNSIIFSSIIITSISLPKHNHFISMKHGHPSLLSCPVSGVRCPCRCFIVDKQKTNPEHKSNKFFLIENYQS